MRKLTFERAILIVLAVIIFISTTEIRERYTDIFIDKLFKKDKHISSDVQSGKNRGFPTMFLKADNLYNEGNYEEAASEYFTLTLNNALSIEQKARANFRLGICQYYLKNYRLAFERFEAAAKFSPNDSVIYNNAAVSAYRAKEMKSAIEYQTKALRILPAVEYYYNLARMFEDNEQYDEAVNNYLVVTKAEQNLSRVDKIDPVRVKEKVARLLPNSPTSMLSEVLIALKLKRNMNEILTVNDNEMQIKSSDFIVKVENNKGLNNIVAEYDRKKNDPYNLISEVVWTVFKNGKQVYKKSSDKIKINAAESGSYKVNLNIRFYGNNDKQYSKTVRISNNKSTIDTVKQDDIVVSPPPNQSTRTYEYASYEQLFESDFDISSKGYTDRFNVVWGKDEGIETQSNNKDAMDKTTSLLVSNKSNRDAGLWVNLDALLKVYEIKGKNVRISFYSKEISSNAQITINARVKSGNSYTIIPKAFYLNNKWQQQYLDVYIPKDANGFTISLSTKPNAEINIDGFIVMD